MAGRDEVRVFGFAGSLREKSYNRGLLRAAAEELPEGMTLETFDLSPIPLFNDDVRARGFPEAVQEFRGKIAEADAILIACPEYNFSMTGVMKNAIDWASRPPDQPFNDKPLGIMGASSGNWGTTRAQHHLRQTAVFVNMHPLNNPQVLVAGAADKFDADGNLTDETTRGFVRDFLQALYDWTLRLRHGGGTDR